LNSEHATLNSEQVTLNCEQATLNCEQATLHCEQATLNSEQATLNCEQATLNSEQATLNGEQATLNSEQATWKEFLGPLVKTNVVRRPPIVLGPCQSRARRWISRAIGMLLRRSTTSASSPHLRESGGSRSLMVLVHSGI
jgi:hypothetical protein